MSVTCPIRPIQDLSSEKEKANQKMLKAEEIVKKSFSAWANNFIIVLPFVFSALANVILIVPFFVSIIFSIAPLSFVRANIGKFSSITSLTGLITNAKSFLSPSFLVYGVIFLVASLFINAYFSAGATGMAKEIWKGRKISLNTMHKYGKYFYWRYLKALSLLVLIVIGIFAAVAGTFSLPFFITKNPGWIPLLILGMLISFFLAIFFSLTLFCLVAENSSVKKSISKSCQLVRKNYFSFLGILILFGLMIGGTSMITRIIPFIGGRISTLANLLIFRPVLTIAMMLFVLDRSKSKFKRR